MNEIRVNTAKPYSVCIETGSFQTAASRIASVCGGPTVGVVSDDTVFSLYGQSLCSALEKCGRRVVPFVFEHGEQSKNLSVYGELVAFLADKHVTRSDALIALGGGVVGDLTGFAAATYLRGVKYVQIPTTLLAAVDSSVGGKTAVDLPNGKNLVGCFYQPSFVLCDPALLRSLPENIYRDGCAEVIKYGMLGNPELLDALTKLPAKEQLTEVIAVCVGMKRDIVSADEYDRGQRQLLNFGHTFGHAIEACSRFSVSHGCAVAIGMAMMTLAAETLGFCKKGVYDRLCSLLEQYSLPKKCSFSADMLFGALCADKKVLGADINLIIPEAYGHSVIHTVPLAEVPEWLRAGGAV